MRWSQAFIPTLRDDPTDAEAISHKLLVRAGFVRQLMAGSYSLLPPAMRVRAKIMEVIRQEINAIGGQEFLLPALHPAEIWQKSGRWSSVGQEMFRLKDRKEADLVLGMTHEEVFSTLATEMKSYKELPQLWYQIQTKFRDEPRPKSGVLRVREFTMKDSYSFNIDQAGLDVQFEAHRQAYINIFRRIGTNPIPVEASSGLMGGSGSVEFMVLSDAGEDFIVTCDCGYAANLERATSALPDVDDPETAELETFDTPGVRTIKALEEFEGGAPADRQLKTLLYMIDDELTLVVVRGDHDLQEQKLIDVTGGIDIRPATEQEIRPALGASPGSLGAVGISDYTILVDEAVRGRTGMTTGANIDDKHLRNVDVGRDIEVTKWVDVRAVKAGEACALCGKPLSIDKAIEVGHIFKLGTKYAEAMGAEVLDPNGKPQTLLMGSYGIGVERAMAAVVEACNDEKGIVWPVSVAPYEILITVLRPDDEPTLAAATSMYEELSNAGFDVMLDDRNERPGVKFADAELVGFPYRLTVGPRGIESGMIELTTRSTNETREVALSEAVADVSSLVAAARA